MPQSRQTSQSGIVPKINMGVLMDRSGLSRQTIHFYLRKGLLPPANKTSRTYAVYLPDTLELLRLIKECQTELRLSLDEIAHVFQQAGYNVQRINAALDSRRSLPGPLQESTPGAGRLSKNASAGSPPPPELIDAVQACGLLPVSGNRHSQPSSGLIRSIWELSRLGIKPDRLKPISAHMKAEAEAELVEFREVLGAKCPDYASAIRLLSAFQQFVCCQRDEALRNAFATHPQASRDLFIGPNRKHMFPSETLLAKMGLNREIDRLLIHLDQKPDEKASLIDLSRAYYLRSDWLNLYGISEKILQLDPSSARATADMCRAMYYLGRIDDAVRLLEDWLRVSPDPLLKFRLGQSLVLQAKSWGIPEFLQAVVRKQQLAAEALHETNDPRIQRWIRLDIALDDLSVSDPLHMNPPRATDLEQLHQEYQVLPEKGLSVLSRMSLIRGRILAAYALYVVYSREQHPKTEQLKRKIIQMDPYGALASRASNFSRAAGSPVAIEQIKRERVGAN